MVTAFVKRAKHKQGQRWSALQAASKHYSFYITEVVVAPYEVFYNKTTDLVVLCKSNDTKYNLQIFLYSMNGSNTQYEKTFTKLTTGHELLSI